jgi:RNA recognition motif-containing protein
MMDAKLYVGVGNLSSGATGEDLKALFSRFGKVKDAKVIEGKRFGFVEMSTRSEAESARRALSGRDFQGRELKVDTAFPPMSREQGYGGR